jgi:hypothetical protein
VNRTRSSQKSPVVSVRPVDSRITRNEPSTMKSSVKSAGVPLRSISNANRI